MTSLLACKNVCKSYQDNDRQVDVLDNLNFNVEAGQQVAIVGNSGSGKSTLLHILGALDKPSSGEVWFNGENIFSYNEKRQARFRNQQLGFVYQFHHLLPEFTALENVAMPLLIAGMKLADGKVKAASMLERVGLGHRFDHKPAQLSGGERQRVAIARALINDPAMVLADEPTGNLDERTGETIYQLIRELRHEVNTSFVIVTHDHQLAARLDVSWQLSGGQLLQLEP